MTDEAGAWEPWSFEERRRLARYVSDEAEDSFPVADKVGWRLAASRDRLAVIQKVYERLAGLPEGQRLFYALEEYHPDAQKQPVRSPRKIWEARRGTCLDLTLLFCGLCLPLRLCPVVVVARDHAYVLLALKRTVGGPLPVDETPLREGPVTDLELLRRLVEEERYLALECTGFAEVKDGEPRPPLTFEAAVEAGRKNLSERGLRFALDVASARYVWGEPALPERAGEPPWPLLRRRWAQWEEGRRNEVRFREQLEANVVDSGVLGDFESFLQDPVWHKKVERLVDRITGAPTGDEGVQELQERLGSVDLTASYPTVLDGLRDALAHPGPKVIQNRIRRLESQAGHGPDAGELAVLRDARDDLFELQEEVRQPRHGRCLLLLGEAGSGKTHLSVAFQPDLAAAEDQVPSPDEEWRSLLLRVRRDDPGGTLREKMEGLLQRITGYGWKGLEHFQEGLWRAESWLQERDARMSHGVPRLVVVLDDLDRWLRTRAITMDELENLILETSRLHSLYWVLTLQHTAFPEVARHRDFWSAYAWLKDGGREESASRARQQIGSWIDLDGLNELERLGIQLVEQVSEAEDGKPLPVGIRAGSPAERDLSNPQNAWTLLHCRHELDVDYLINLNFIGYVERFWELRQKRIDPAPLEPAVLQRLVGVATAVMAEGLGFQPLSTALASAVAQAEKGRSALQDPDKVETGIRILESAGLWQEIETRDEMGPVLGLELRNQFFWSFQVAQHLAGRLKSRDRWELGTLLPEGTDPYLREGVIEFLLLLTNEGRLWQQAVQLPGPTRASAWIGAAKAEADIQRLVVDASREVEPEGDREVFAFLYFVGEADPEVLSPMERLELLQPYFPTIAAAGQVDYFLHVLLKALERVESREELLGVLQRLVGVEVLGETRKAAYWIADAVVRVAGKEFERALELLIDYARQESARIGEVPDPPPPPDAEREDGKYRLREWIFFATLDTGADIQIPNGPADLFEILWRVYWYDAHRLQVTLNPVGFEMEAQANTVLGYQYRQASWEEREEYERMVADLAQAESWYKRKLAFFLIRHSVPTGGRRGVRVHDAFHPVLAALFLDPDSRVQKNVKRFYEDFRVNLEHDYDFPALERERSSIVEGMDLDRRR
jgi:hypothetical protein